MSSNDKKSCQNLGEVTKVKTDETYDNFRIDQKIKKELPDIEINDQNLCSKNSQGHMSKIEQENFDSSGIDIKIEPPDNNVDSKTLFSRNSYASVEIKTEISSSEDSCIDYPVNVDFSRNRKVDRRKSLRLMGKDPPRISKGRTKKELPTLEHLLDTVCENKPEDSETDSSSSCKYSTWDDDFENLQYRQRLFQVSQKCPKLAALWGITPLSQSSEGKYELVLMNGKVPYVPGSRYVKQFLEVMPDMSDSEDDEIYFRGSKSNGKKIKHPTFGDDGKPLSDSCLDFTWDWLYKDKENAHLQEKFRHESLNTPEAKMLREIIESRKKIAEEGLAKGKKKSGACLAKGKKKSGACLAKKKKQNGAHLAKNKKLGENLAKDKNLGVRLAKDQSKRSQYSVKNKKTKVQCAKELNCQRSTATGSKKNHHEALNTLEAQRLKYDIEVRKKIAERLIKDHKKLATRLAKDKKKLSVYLAKDQKNSERFAKKGSHQASSVTRSEKFRHESLNTVKAKELRDDIEVKKKLLERLIKDQKNIGVRLAKDKKKLAIYLAKDQKIVQPFAKEVNRPSSTVTRSVRFLSDEVSVNGLVLRVDLDHCDI